MNCGHRNKAVEEGKGGQAQGNTRSLYTSESLFRCSYHGESVTTVAQIYGYAPCIGI